MIGLLLLLVVGQVDGQLTSYPRVREVGARQRGRENVTFAQFEAFPANGRGTAGVCSTTAPTGAKGEALTFTRASNGTCTKTATGGLAATGIADGDLVVLTNNQPRVEYDSQGVLGLLVESAANQICVRTAELCNAAWSDVGTPACATDQATGPFGTTTMDSITDNDAVAFEGRSQVISSTSATQFTAFCHVKWSSGAAASASLTLVGTGSSTGDCTGTKTGLSTTSSSIVECTSPAAYAGTLTAVTMTIRVGTVVGDQGTLLVEGCDVKPSAPYRTSHQPATNIAVTRSAETATFAVAATVTAGNYSQAVTVQSPAGAGTFVPLIAYTDASNYVALYQSGSTWSSDLRQAAAGVVATNASSGMATPTRLVGFNDGTTQQGLLSGVAFSTPAAGTKTVSVTTLALGQNVGGTGQVDGIVSRACWQPIDPGGTRCR